MKETNKNLITVLGLIILQATGARIVSFPYLFPDLLLIYLLFLSRQKKILNVILLSFISGFFQDLLAGSVPGVFACSKTIACYTAFYLHSELSEENNLARFSGFVIPVIVHTGVLSVLYFFRGFLVSPVLLIKYLFAPMLVTLSTALIFDFYQQIRANKVKAW